MVSSLPVVLPLYKRIVSLFPQNYFRFCFAYGSGVFKQGGTNVGNPMIDMIFVVDDSKGFHCQNMHMNPSHYSFVKKFGHKFIAFLQEKWPSRVYFNTLIPLEGEGIMFKYGVVNSIDLINDLFDWDYLYLAGRLHKPVKIVEPPTKDISTALRQNLNSALHTALLILPETFTERDLYKVITSLSYNGDFRMYFGEDKNKVNNIVDNQLLEFRILYRPYLNNLIDVVEISDKGLPDEICVQDVSSLSRMYHLFQLPKIAQTQLIKYWISNVGNRKRDAEDVLRNLANNPEVGYILSDCLKNVVFRSSVQQSVKGIFSAGLIKSLKYSNKKIEKMINARGQTS